MQIYIIEALLLVFLIITTVCVIFCKDILCAAVIYSEFSFCAVLLYLMMGAPDVAFTEAVIGTISTIYFVVSLKKIDRWLHPSLHGAVRRRCGYRRRRLPQRMGDGR